MPSPVADRFSPKLRSLHPRAASAAAVVFVAALATVAALLAGLPRADAEPAGSGTSAVLTVERDGSTALRAAASCWEIKQDYPDLPSGKYWLQTPELGSPQQFWCDQTTDGGGWVLVGRGRHDWTENYNGNSTPAALASASIEGTDAFGPRQLDAHVIDALFAGQDIDSSPLRVRRAANSTGSAWQEVRLQYTDRDRWTWALGSMHPLSSVTINGAAVTAGTTRESGSGQGGSKILFNNLAAGKYVTGFNYGATVTGSSASTSYLFSRTTGGGYATPFAQLWVRPKVTQEDLTYEPLAGVATEASSVQAAPENRALTQQWGVSGLGAGGTSENDSEVQAFAQIGDRVYVGGNFTTVTRGQNGTGENRVSQPYLAAFDATTGEFLRDFTPQLDNQVKAIVALPSGNLAVGGDFSTVNGVATRALTVLDPVTGATSTEAIPTVVNKLTSGLPPSVRTLDVAGGFLYVGGYFTHLQNGTKLTYTRNVGRFTLGTGQADGTWSPESNGTIRSLDVSEDGSRVYLAGYPTRLGTTAVREGVAVSTAAGAAIVPWAVQFSATTSYQQAVHEAGSLVWLGGSQHSMFGYATDSLTLASSSITWQGGDLQAIASGGGVVLGGCHCENYNFEGATQYTGTWNIPGWTQSDRIQFLGAWDATTGAYVPDFTPDLKSRKSLGVWALLVAADGTVWAGGTITQARTTNNKLEWTGGFARFAPRDTTAPTTPSNVKATAGSSKTQITWTGVGDASQYEVIVGDRVVATVSGTSTSIPLALGSDVQVAVRARDTSGNRSASTVPVNVTASAPAAQAAPATTTPTTAPTTSATATPTPTAPTTTATAPSTTATTAPQGSGEQSEQR